MRCKPRSSVLADSWQQAVPRRHNLNKESPICLGFLAILVFSRFSRTTGSPERHAIRLVHPEILDIAFYFEHNRISKILRLDQSKRAKSVVGKSRPRICEKCTDFSGLASLLPFPLPLSFHTARAALAAPPRHLRSWIGQHARFEPGEAASHTAVRRRARLPARPPCACV